MIYGIPQLLSIRLPLIIKARKANNHQKTIKLSSVSNNHVCWSLSHQSYTPKDAIIAEIVIPNPARFSFISLGCTLAKNSFQVKK